MLLQLRRERTARVKWIMTGLQTKILLGAATISAVLLGYYLNFTSADTENLLKSNGRIEATEIAVASKTSGRIKELFVDEGDFVEAGQLVATVASESLEAQLHQDRKSVV